MSTTPYDIAECHAELARLGWKVKIGDSGRSLKLICTRDESSFVCVGQIALAVWRSALDAARRNAN